MLTGSGRDDWAGDAIGQGRSSVWHLCGERRHRVDVGALGGSGHQGCLLLHELLLLVTW